MILNHWTDDAWADDSWVPESWGIGLAEEPGIGLAAPRGPVDIVISRDWYPQSRPKVVNFEARKAVKQETDELREMLEIYSRWRKAA